MHYARSDHEIQLVDGYVSESLAKHGIRVLTPDAFLDTTLQENPDAIMGTIQS